MRITAILVLLVQCVYAQSPQVPHKTNFAGITLTIRDDARREIQKDVDALTQYPKYFNIKVERAKTYFPIIEKIFAEERLPDDFKYLVLQESALIADAVSVSDAVGFWQFKDFTAMEMGLRVDKEVDERMNIASSTRAAAQYIKKNNHYFNNWVYALQAYQMGAGGVMKSISDYESGTKHMEITSKTYWYVKKFLAHMIAFEGAVKGSGYVKVIAYESNEKKSLNDLAREFAVDEEQLKEYNKWVRKGTIPDDRKYMVAIPVKGEAKEVYAAVEKANAHALRQTQHKKLDAKPAIAGTGDRKYIHGLPAIKANAGESSASLAKRSGISLSSFLSWNDLSISDPLIEGQYYYIKKKKSRSQVAQHKVLLDDETLWSISQQYGVQLKKIRKANPSLSSSKLKKGTLVSLPTGFKPGFIKTSEPTYDVAEVERGEFFSWSVSPKADEVLLVVDSKNTEPVVYPPQPVADTGKYPTSNTPQPTQASQHVVSAGETLYSISKRYGVGVMDLVNWNNLKLEEGIKPGQVIKMNPTPAALSAQTDDFIIYEVKATDTLYSVARQHGVTIKELMEWNKKKDFNVSTGEKLRIQQK